MSTTFSKKSKNLFFSSDVTVFSLHEQHDASLNFGFRTHIILAKNVPWHILTPSAVACDMFLLRASAHHWHVSAFFCNREFQGISYYKKTATLSPVWRLLIFMRHRGFEPRTTWLKVKCSTDWANTPYAQNRNRTSDTRIFSPLLYQLSYLGVMVIWFYAD